MPDLSKIEGFQVSGPVNSLFRHEKTSTSGSLTYRATRKSDGSKVVLKILNAAYPTDAQLQRYNNEYLILKMLEGVGGVIQVLELIRLDKTLALVFKDINGISLMDWISLVHEYNSSNMEGSRSVTLTNSGARQTSLEMLTRLNKEKILRTTLKVFSQIASTLIDIHDRHIIHGDINPSNILWDMESSTAFLLDFGSAFDTRQRKNTGSSVASSPGTSNQSTTGGSNPRTQNLDASLQYTSPELLGRADAHIDHRADFYSLGCTMYQVFTGRPPFYSEDPLEIIHSHIAKEAKPPYALQSEKSEFCVIPIPEMVSKIIMKMLAKEPRHRYFSAYGIQKDLEICQEYLRSAEDGDIVGSIPTFELGGSDVNTQFEMPTKMYGHEQETKQVTEIIDQSFYARKKNFVILKGVVGIGKTTFANSLERYVVKRKGLFIRGKFDEFNINRPFFGIAQVVSGLLLHTLKGNKDTLNNIKSKIAELFGNDPKEVLDLLPDLRHFLDSGKRDKNGSMAANSVNTEATGDLGASGNFPFHRRLQDLICMFATKENPLVLFLDGFQWVDSSSLSLLESLFSSRKLSHVLIICAYRINPERVEEDNKALDSLSRSLNALNVTLTELDIRELEVTHIKELLVDGMKLRQEDVEEFENELMDLVNVIFKKTMGNPMFVHSFVNDLFSKGFIHYKTTTSSTQSPIDTKENRKNSPGRWLWDVDSISRLPATENVAQLLSDKVGSLPLETLIVFKVASCFGNVFSPTDLMPVISFPRQEVLKHLEKGMEIGLIVQIHMSDDDETKEATIMRKSGQPSLRHATSKGEISTSSVTNLTQSSGSNTEFQDQRAYKFTHDRVQSLVYGMISQEERYKYHWDIGQYLLKKYKNDAKTIKIFDIVDQLNLARKPVEDEMRIIMADLNYKAGKKAKSSGAYTSALSYFKKGIGLMKESYWKFNSSSEYRLLLNLHLEAFEIVYMTSDENYAEELRSRLSKYTYGNFDRVLYKTMMNQVYSLNSEYSNIVTNSLKILQLLKMTLPTNAISLSHYANYFNMMLEGRKANIMKLDAQEESKSRRAVLASKVLLFAIQAAYYSRNHYYFLFLTHFIKLGLESRLPSSPVAYMHLGSFLFTTDYHEKGGQLMTYSLKIGQNNSNAVTKAKVLGYYDNICAHFCYNVNTEFKYFQDAYDECFREGDSEQGVFFLVRSMLSNVYFGHSLDGLQNRLKTKTSELLQFYKAKSSIEEYYYLLHQFCSHLKGTEDMPQTVEFWNLKGFAAGNNAFGESQVVDGVAKQGDGDDYGYYRFLRSVVQMMVDYFMEYDKYEEAVKEFQSAPMQFFDTLSSCDMIWAMFFECLLLCRNEYYLLDKEIEKVKENGKNKKMEKGTNGHDGHFFRFSLHPTTYQQTRINYTYKRFKLFSSRCPENYLHPCLLLKALRAGLKGHVRKALACFDRAIVEAERVKNTRNWAIANECKGHYLLHIEQWSSSIAYLKEASYLYRLWGASAKADLIDRQIGQILAGNSSASSTGPNRKAATFAGGVQSSIMAANYGDASSDHENTDMIMAGKSNLNPPGVVVNGPNSVTIMGDESPTALSLSPGFSRPHRGNNIDIFASLKLAQTLSGVASFDLLVEKLLTLLLQNSGAQRAQFIEMIDDEPCLVSEAFYEKVDATNGPGGIHNNNGSSNTGGDDEGLGVAARLSTDDMSNNNVNPASNANDEVVKVLSRNVQLDEGMSPMSVVNFVARMRQMVMLDDAEASPEYQDDPYVLKDRPKSILCIPMGVSNDKVKGICYLENRLIQGAFTPERLRLTNILAVQAAITIENLNLSRKNEELVNALTAKTDSSKYNVDAPIKRVIDILLKIKTNTRDTDRAGNTAKDIDFIVQTLISNKLFSLDLDRIDDGKGNAIDEQTKQWINSQIMQTSHTITVTAPPREGSNSANGSASLNGSTLNTGLGLASTRSSMTASAAAKRLSAMHGFPDQQQSSQQVPQTQQNASNATPLSGSQGKVNDALAVGGIFGRKISSLQKIASVGSDLDLEAMESSLGAFPEEVQDWNFSNIGLSEKNNNPLFYMGMHLFMKLECQRNAHVDIDVFKIWLKRIESKYQNHPYHNKIHATDVLHAMYMLILRDCPLLEGKLTALEQFAVIFSASAHDVDHPGLNNLFLIKTNNPLAVLYNDSCVLEAHHSATAFGLTFHEECDIFSEFKEAEYRDFRKMAVTLILSTDMSKHFELLSKFKTKISTTGIDPTVQEDRRFMMEIGIKMADLNNPSKPLETALCWTNRIMEEFFLQGDKEREYQVDISMFMDRNNTSIPKCQLGFIDIFVAPLYDAWGTLVDCKTIKTCKENLVSTRQYWANVLANTSTTTVPNNTPNTNVTTTGNAPSIPTLSNPASVVVKPQPQATTTTVTATPSK